MKTVRYVSSIVLVLAFLTGCGAQTAPASSSEAVSTPASAPAATPTTGSEPEPQSLDTLQPAPDYGTLTIFSRPTGLEKWPRYMYGLLDSDNQVVLDPVLTSLWETQYNDGQCNYISTGILRLGQAYDNEGHPWLNETVAFAARDGSWVTGFDYWGGIGFPGGVAATSDEGISLLDPGSGESYRSWTWKELGQIGPEAVPCVGGDVYTTAQWMDGRLQIGEVKENGQRMMLMLNPDTGTVEKISLEVWIALCDQVHGG